MLKGLGAPKPKSQALKFELSSFGHQLTAQVAGSRQDPSEPQQKEHGTESAGSPAALGE